MFALTIRWNDMVVSSYIYREYWHMFLYIRNSAHKLSVKLITMAKLEVFSEDIPRTIIVEQSGTEVYKWYHVWFHVSCLYPRSGYMRNN